MKQITIILGIPIDSIRAENALDEDRLVILEEAKELAVSGIRKYRDNKYMLYTYCYVCVEIYKMSGNISVFESAINETKKVEKYLGDPEISRKIDDYDRKIVAITDSSF